MQVRLPCPFPDPCFCHSFTTWAIGRLTLLAAWESVQINVGYGDDDFSIGTTGLEWSAQDGFGGWLGE